MTRKQEILLILMEECAEVAQQASKCIRFGGAENEALLEKEIGDLICMTDLLSEDGVINYARVHEQALVKENKLKVFSSIFDKSDVSD